MLNIFPFASNLLGGHRCFVLSLSAIVEDVDLIELAVVYCSIFSVFHLNGSQLAKKKKSIPDMSLP